MKFPPFDYLRPDDLSEAIEALAGDDDATVLAGGQSLLPLMALRLARPSLLVDFDRLDLAAVTVRDGVLRIGAMTRQCTLQDDPTVARAAPLVPAAVRHVGHRSTRTRGTLGGSLAHGDPAAELPAVMVALGAAVVTASPAGTRTIACGDLSTGFFSTCLGRAEVITEIQVPVAAAGSGWSWCEWAPRAGDFADAGVGVGVTVDPAGTCTSVGAAACGVGSVPLDLGPLLAPVLTGTSGSEPALIRHVATVVEEESGSELAGLLAGRAVHRAFASAAARDGAAE